MYGNENQVRVVRRRTRVVAGFGSADYVTLEPFRHPIEPVLGKPVQIDS